MVQWRKFLPLLIITLAITAYLNSLSGVFLFDDHVVITGNPQIDRFLPMSLSSRLVVDLTFKVNHLVGGLKPADYHAVNLLIHIFAGLLLYGIVRRTLVLPCFNGKYADMSDLLAGACACIYLLSFVMWCS